MIFGYARVSTNVQSTEAQKILLTAANCESIIEEKESGKDLDGRDKLSGLLNGYLRYGDTLVITSLDRLSRSTIDTLLVIQELERKGIALKILNLDVDTSNAMGKFCLSMFAAISELERFRIKERQAQGIELAKKKGVYKGRAKLDTKNNQKIISANERGIPISHIAANYGISRPSVYKIISEANGLKPRQRKI